MLLNEPAYADSIDFDIEIGILWRETVGEADIRIAVLDGPVDMTHPSLQGARLATNAAGTPEAVTDGATPHGTQIASVVFGQHNNDGPLKGVAPGCTGLIVPVFRDVDHRLSCSQMDLARGIAALPR